MLYHKNVLFVFRERKVIELADTESKGVKTIPVSGIEENIVNMAYDAEKAVAYLIDDKKNVFRGTISEITFSNATTLAFEKITLQGTLPDLSPAVAFYAEKLYFLAPAEKQIKKLDLKNGTITNWLSNPSELVSEGIGIAIDSNIYTLSEKTITRFFKGSVSEWNAGDIGPPPQGLTGIDTNASMESITLIDAGTKRVIVLNKDGDVQNQFSSSRWESILETAYNIDKKQIFVLSGNEVYMLPL
jgi:hypothetical protein